MATALEAADFRIQCLASKDASCVLDKWLTSSPCGSEIEFVIDASCSDSSTDLTNSSRENSSTSSASSETTDSVSLGAESFLSRESHACTTKDGWQLHLQHVYDPTADAPRRDCPVLMVPGLASSGAHTFDLMPECSLVNTLVAKGYDVWVADLRGNGRSQKPSVFDSTTWWTVDDHFHKDVPAVMEYVLAHTGAKQLHWIGHSMGGMLGVGLLSQQGKLASTLRSVTLIASGCFGKGSWHSILKPLINRITAFGFPAGLVCQLIGALSGSTSALWLIEALFYWPTNTPLEAAKRLMAGCFQFIPVGVIRQFLNSLNTEQGLASVDSTFRYADPQVLANVQVPVQGLNGSWDLFCPAAGGQKTVEMFGSASKRFVCFGPKQGTGQRHYGHFDIICGKSAPQEVYPYVTSWLEQHDAPL